MPITKATGFTDTERLLADLCDRTFLRLWSFPNPFKDDGHELCDLIAVFDQHVFVFFDREAKHFDKTGNEPQVMWERWKRDAIEKQIRTARGAERYLRAGGKVFLDPKREVPFPLEIPGDQMVIHKIIVAHGAKEACMAASADNVYGSLAVTYSDSSRESGSPFMIHLERTNPVHVLDSHNLPILFAELDTITDLLQYIEAKGEAIATYDSLVYCGEEDLIAHYYGNFDKAANRHYIGIRKERANGVMIGEGEWKGLIERPEYKRKVEANRTSYLWDEFIQRTSQNALDGTLIGNAQLLTGDSAIHEMAREPRFSRRALSDNMLRVFKSFPNAPGRALRWLTFMPSFYPDKGYVMLQIQHDGSVDADEFRNARRYFLEIACGAAKNYQPHLNTIVGIALDPPMFGGENGEDFILMDCSDWSDDQRKYYEAANQELGFFQSPTLEKRMQTIQNFPDGPQPATAHDASQTPGTQPDPDAQGTR